MNTPFRLLSTLALVAVAAGCASHSPSHSGGPATITGTVTHPAGANLPAGSSLAVYLVENTWTSEAIEVLRNQVFEPVPASGSPYSLSYDPAEIESTNRYTLGARITDSKGKVLYRSNGYLVLTRGGPKDGVNITLTAPLGTAK